MIAAFVSQQRWPSLNTGLVLAFVLPYGNCLFSYIALKGRVPFNRRQERP